MNSISGSSIAARSGALLMASLVLALVLILGGCGIVAQVTPTAQPTQQATAAGAEPTSGIDKSGEEGSIRVPLAVLQAPDGSTLALVPVSINGQGPFRFALDTGASKSLVDSAVADQLQLQVVGSAGQVTGVAGAANADLVAITDWSAGDVKLNQTQAVKLSLSDGGGGGGPTIQGLLGSDVLSQYGAIQVDYVNQILILTPK